MRLSSRYKLKNFKRPEPEVKSIRKEWTRKEEVELLRLLHEGWTRSQAAILLGRSAASVCGHLQLMMKRDGVIRDWTNEKQRDPKKHNPVSGEQEGDKDGQRPILKDRDKEVNARQETERSVDAKSA